MIYFLFLFTGHDPPLTPIILQRHSALHTGCGRAPHRNRNDSTLWTCNPLSLPLFSYPSPSSPSLPLPRLLFLPPPLLLSLPSYSTPIPSPSPSLSTPRHSLILPSYSLPLLLTPFALPFYYLPHLLLFPPPPLLFPSLSPISSPPLLFPSLYPIPSTPIPYHLLFSPLMISSLPLLFSSSPSLLLSPLLRVFLRSCWFWGSGQALRGFGEGEGEGKEVVEG